MRDHRRAVLQADVEHQPVAIDAQMQRVGTAAVPKGRERILFEQIVDRDFALVLDVFVGTADRFFVEGDGDQALLARGGRCFRGTHFRLRRIATERAWAESPSASPSAIAAGPSARNWSGPHLSKDVRFMKSSTPSPEEKRAERAVGSTWLEPAT